MFQDLAQFTRNKTHNVKNKLAEIMERDRLAPILIGPPPRSIVVKASAWGAGGRGSIPDRVTRKT